MDRAPNPNINIMDHGPRVCVERERDGYKCGISYLVSFLFLFERELTEGKKTASKLGMFGGRHAGMGGGECGGGEREERTPNSFDGSPISSAGYFRLGGRDVFHSPVLLRLTLLRSLSLFFLGPSLLPPLSPFPFATVCHN